MHPASSLAADGSAPLEAHAVRRDYSRQYANPGDARLDALAVQQRADGLARHLDALGLRAEARVARDARDDLIALREQLPVLDWCERCACARHRKRS